MLRDLYALSFKFTITRIGVPTEMGALLPLDLHYVLLFKHTEIPRL